MLTAIAIKGRQPGSKNGLAVKMAVKHKAIAAIAAIQQMAKIATTPIRLKSSLASFFTGADPGANPWATLLLLFAATIPILNLIFNV